MYSLHRDTPSFIIDSDDRLDGTITEFTANVFMKPNNKYNMVSLIHAGIPKTYYNIDSQNNEMMLRENAIYRTINIPVGQYTVTNLPTILNAYFDSISAYYNPATPWTYVFTWNDFTNKWLLTVTEHAGRPMIAESGLVFYGHQTHDLLGFLDTPYNYSITGGVGTVTSVNIPSFERTEYFTIKSNIANNAGNADPDSSVLARIPIDNYLFDDYIIYDVIQLADSVKNITNNTSNVYTFGLYDDHDRLINLNGRGWYFTLFMYEHNSLPMRELQLLDEQKEQQERQREFAGISNKDSQLDIQNPLPKIIEIEDNYIVDNNAIELNE